MSSRKRGFLWIFEIKIIGGSAYDFAEFYINLVRYPSIFGILIFCAVPIPLKILFMEQLGSEKFKFFLTKNPLNNYGFLKRENEDRGKILKILNQLVFRAPWVGSFLLRSLFAEIIYWNITRFQSRFHLPQVKKDFISSIINFSHELPHELLNDLGLRKLGNIKNL